MKPLKLIISFILGINGLPLASDADDLPPSNPPSPVHYGIVVTGSELLEGEYADAHIAFITKTLHPLGYHCIRACIAGDEAGELVSALKFAAQETQLVMITGGLGPTPNDITRETLSDFTGIPLQEQPQVMAEMESRFHTARPDLRENLRRQTRVPVSGDFLRNPHGTAVGLVYFWGKRLLVALPGPPKELRPMVQNELVPFLTRRFGTTPPGATLTLRFAGLGQSAIAEAIQRNVHLPPGVFISSQFEGGRVDFTFTCPGKASVEAAGLKRVETEVMKVLGDFIYANDPSSLEDQIIRKLRERNGRLSVIEIGTGGRVAASLSRARNTVPVMAGSWTAPSFREMMDLLGIATPAEITATNLQPTLAALSQTAAQRSKANYMVLSVADPDPRPDAGQFWIATGYTNALTFQSLRVSQSSEILSDQFSTQVMTLVYRQLRSIPTPGKDE